VTGFRYDSVAGARAWNPPVRVGTVQPVGAVTTDSEQMSLYASY